MWLLKYTQYYLGYDVCGYSVTFGPQISVFCNCLLMHPLSLSLYLYLYCSRSLTRWFEFCTCKLHTHKSQRCIQYLSNKRHPPTRFLKRKNIVLYIYIYMIVHYSSMILRDTTFPDCVYQNIFFQICIRIKFKKKKFVRPMSTLNGVILLNLICMFWIQWSF